MNERGEGLDGLKRALGVQRSGRFIGQHHLRVVDQGAGNGDALLLTTRKLARQIVEPIAQAQTCQQFTRTRLARFVQLTVEAQHQLHILLRRQIGHQVVGLKSKADLLAAKSGAFCFAHGAQVLPADQNRAGRRFEQRSQHGKHRCFARPAGANQGHKFPFMDTERNSIHRVDQAAAALVGFRYRLRF